MKLKLQIHLAASRLGRIVLHVAAIVAGGKFVWHVAGIVREL